MQVLVQLVSIKVKAECTAEFLEAFRINYEGTRREPGNLRFDVLRDPEDPTAFFIYEVFRSEAALDEHRRTAHYQECIGLLEPISERPRTKRYFTAIMADFLPEESTHDS